MVLYVLSYIHLLVSAKVWDHAGADAHTYYHIVLLCVLQLHVNFNDYSIDASLNTFKVMSHIINFENWEPFRIFVLHMSCLPTPTNDIFAAYSSIVIQSR